MICLHRVTRQGGDLSIGKWCVDCGALVRKPRGTARDQAYAKEKREAAFYRRAEALKLELHRQSNLNSDDRGDQ